MIYDPLLGSEAVDTASGGASAAGRGTRDSSAGGGTGGNPNSHMHRSRHSEVCIHASASEPQCQHEEALEPHPLQLVQNENINMYMWLSKDMKVSLQYAACRTWTLNCESTTTKNLNMYMWLSRGMKVSWHCAACGTWILICPGTATMMRSHCALWGAYLLDAEVAFGALLGQAPCMPGIPCVHR